MRTWVLSLESERERERDVRTLNQFDAIGMGLETCELEFALGRARERARARARARERERDRARARERDVRTKKAWDAKTTSLPWEVRTRVRSRRIPTLALSRERENPRLDDGQDEILLLTPMNYESELWTSQESLSVRQHVCVTQPNQSKSYRTVPNHKHLSIYREILYIKYRSAPLQI